MRLLITLSAIPSHRKSASVSPLSFANGRTANDVIAEESIPRSVRNGDVLVWLSARMYQKPAIRMMPITPIPIQNSPRRVGADIAEPEDVDDGIEDDGAEVEAGADTDSE